VGYGCPIDVLTIVNSLVNNFDTTSKIVVSGKYRMGDIRHNYADINKISNKLRFYPKIDFRSGIAKFAKWVKKQPIPQDMYKTSLDEIIKKGIYK
jgi:dTDP-L-rhamnose 4-epimerase